MPKKEFVSIIHKLGINMPWKCNHVPYIFVYIYLAKVISGTVMCAKTRFVSTYNHKYTHPHTAQIKIWPKIEETHVTRFPFKIIDIVSIKLLIVVGIYKLRR